MERMKRKERWKEVENEWLRKNEKELRKDRVNSRGDLEEYK